MVVHACNPKYAGSRGKRIIVQGQAEVQDPISNNMNSKWTGTWLKWYSTCLATVRPWVQFPVLPLKKERTWTDTLFIFSGHFLHKPFLDYRSPEGIVTTHISIFQYILYYPELLSFFIFIFSTFLLYG
jgi:hypothetical protein